MVYGKANDEPELPIQVVPIAKQPVEIVMPTFEVEVAEPLMLRPDNVVVPKPMEETESWVAVDEPTTKPIESPPIGLTESRAKGVVVPTPSSPLWVKVLVAVPPNEA